MKKSLSVLILLLLVLLTNAQEWEHTLSKGLTNAYINKKIVIIDFYTDWCSWCKKLDADVFSTEKFKKFTNKDFKLIRINAEKYKKTTKKYSINGYPTILVLNSYGQELDRVVGYSNADEYIDRLNSAAYSATNFYNLNKIYSEGGANWETTYLLAEKLYAQNDIMKANKLFKEVLAVNKNHRDIYEYMYLIELKNKDLKKAKYYLSKYIDLNQGKKDEATLSFAKSLNGNGFFKEADIEYNKLMNNKTEDKLLYYAHYYRIINTIYMKDTDKMYSYMKEFETSKVFNEKTFESLKRYYGKYAKKEYR